MIPKNDTFENSIRTVEDNIYKILRNNTWFSSDRVDNELVDIANGLRQLWLDNNIQSSTKYSRRQDSQHILTARGDLVQVLTEIRNFLNQYMNKFNINEYKELNYNQKNSIEQWARVSFDNIMKKLGPHVIAATTRINCFSDDVGVTNRYLVYRNNVTKPSKTPYVYEPQWMRDRPRQLKETNAILLDHHSKGLQRHLLPSTQQYTPHYVSLEDSPQGYNSDLLAKARGKQQNPIEKMNDCLEKCTGMLGSKLRTGAALLPELTTRGYLTIDSLYPQETVELHDPLPIFCNDTSEKNYSKILKRTDLPLFAYKCTPKPKTKMEELKATQMSAGLEPIINYKSEHKRCYLTPFS